MDKDTPDQAPESREAPKSRRTYAVRPEPLRIRKQSNAWYGLRSALSVMTFIFGVIVAAGALNAFVFQSYYVEGTSMTPTLHDDDRLIIDKTGHSLAEIKGQPYVPGRGDIIVLQSNIPSPGHPGEREQLIKRVVGLPGERVVVESGTLTIFNEANPDGFNADTVLDLQLAPTFAEERIEAVLGEHEVFVTGDNRARGGSLDSRSFGPVDVNSIEGRLWARIFPFSDVRIF